MEAADDIEAAFKPAQLVTLTPIPSSTLNSRRLSSQFSKPTSPIRKKMTASPLAWVSLQGRLIGAEEAKSARAIGGGLNRKEAVAWELSSPIHRVLIVTVVAVAAAKCEKNRQIVQLRKCVQLRDDILMNMQQKLDGLCEQMNIMKDQPQTVLDLSVAKSMDFTSRRSSLASKSDSVCTDCWFCDQSRAECYDFSVRLRQLPMLILRFSDILEAEFSYGLVTYQESSLMKADEMFKSRLSISNEAQQEERRMSDLSDWASSVTSVSDTQLNNLGIEQDTYKLKRECEEKDAAIKELAALIRSKDAASSKRVEELEEVIHRKNTLVTKLKKDSIVLEQKVVKLTRTRRCSLPGSNLEKKQLPTMSNNLLYDMDSPLSSDSDCSFEKQISSIVVGSPAEAKASLVPTLQNSFPCENVSKRNQKVALATPSAKRSLRVPKSRSVSPLQEKLLNHTYFSAASPMLNQVPASVGLNSNRRRAHNGTKDADPQKRWM